MRKWCISFQFSVSRPLFLFLNLSLSLSLSLSPPLSLSLSLSPPLPLSPSPPSLFPSPSPYLSFSPSISFFVSPRGSVNHSWYLGRETCIPHRFTHPCDSLTAALFPAMPLPSMYKCMPLTNELYRHQSQMSSSKEFDLQWDFATGVY